MLEAEELENERVAHLLVGTANGKEEDFQLFMALLDGDRFEGRFRDVEFREVDTHRVHYLHRPFVREPDFGVTSVPYDFPDLLRRAEAPR